MTTEDLEEILEAGTETQTVEFKESFPWEIKKFAKDILAMSNVQDGGTVIIGVREKVDSSFERQGIEPAHKTSYKRDDMKDQMAAYADPHVDFFVDFPKDKQGIEYVVITVQPFQEVPVICKKNSGSELKEGGIYYRNRNRRVESALVSNSHDIRDILERAAVKITQRWKQIGVVAHGRRQDMAVKALEERLKKELQGL